MGKVTNWEEILRESISAAETAEFCYGVHDCTTWAGTTVASYSDIEWTPSWKNKREALTCHDKLPMEDQVSKILGSPIGNVLWTQRGDLVQKDKGLDSALGICIGRKAVFIYKKGICFVDIQDCIYSWRI